MHPCKILVSCCQRCGVRNLAVVLHIWMHAEPVLRHRDRRRGQFRRVVGAGRDRPATVVTLSTAPVVAGGLSGTESAGAPSAHRDERRHGTAATHGCLLDEQRCGQPPEVANSHRLNSTYATTTDLVRHFASVSELVANPRIQLQP